MVENPMMSRLCHVWHQQIFGIRDIGKERGCFLHTHIIHLAFTLLILTNMNDGMFSHSIYDTVVIDAYPNNATVEQGTTLILVCRVVGVPSTTVLSYQWTCPGGYCDAGGVDPEWAARIQQGNILVVNVRRQVNERGNYSCIVDENLQQVGTAVHKIKSVTSKSVLQHYRYQCSNSS